MISTSVEKPINLQRLAYFVAIADERSFTRAAGRYGISQPALSRQIAVLEGELGVTLLERAGSGIIPTAVGREVLAEARQVLSSAQRITRTVQDALQMQMGRLEIATFPTHVAGALLPAIRKWHERYPNVTIHMHEFRTRYALREAIHLGTADIAIGGRKEDWSGPYKLLGINEYVLVLPATDRALLEQRAPIRLEQLAHRQWVLYDRLYGLSDLVDGIFSHAGLQRPAAVIETSQVEAAARLAAAGLGPALVPKVNVPPELIAVSRPFEPVMVSQVYAVSRGRWSASAKAFLEIVAEHTWPALPEEASIIELSLF